MPALIWVALGGAVGAMLRYASMQLTAPVAVRLHGWPVSTLLVNILGSFCIGLLAVWLIHRPADSALRPLLVVGLLGGFTTFSSFSLDTVLLIERGELLLALVNIAANVLLCVIFCAIGLYVARLFQ